MTSAPKFNPFTAGPGDATNCPVCGIGVIPVEIEVYAWRLGCPAPTCDLSRMMSDRVRLPECKPIGLGDNGQLSGGSLVWVEFVREVYGLIRDGVLETRWTWEKA